MGGVTRTPTSAGESPRTRALPATGPVERRSAGREPARGSVLIGPGCEGNLINWSVGGFALESSLAVRVGAFYRLRWRVGGESRLMAGVVRWSRLSRTVAQADGDVAPVFRSGFELVDLLSTEPFRPA